MRTQRYNEYQIIWQLTNGTIDSMRYGDKVSAIRQAKAIGAATDCAGVLLLKQCVFDAWNTGTTLFQTGAQIFG